MNMVVVNKHNNEAHKVYDITYDKAGYPHFLIYKDGQWLRISAKYFEPIDGSVSSFDRLISETFRNNKV